MLRSLWTASSGMKSQQVNIDSISHNLANVNTVSFKKGRVNFQDLMYQEFRAAGAPTATGIEHPTGIQIGLGTKVVSTEKIFTQGSFEQTGNQFDVAIEGDGFFQVTIPTGETAYTRDGGFKVDADGNLTTTEGYLIEPTITIPDNATEFIVGSDGTVAVSIPGETEVTEVGNLETVRFINPAGLKYIGKNSYLETGASGGPNVGTPGEDGLGTLVQGIREMSNVNVVDEMVNMISAQRAYEVNSKAIQTSDEMLQVANGLKR